MDSIDSMIEKFISTVRGVRRAGVVSSDGVLISGHGCKDLPEHTAGILAMADAIVKAAEGGACQHIVSYLTDGVLVFMWAGATTCLVVQADEMANMDILGAEMTRLVSHLKTAPTPLLHTRITGTIFPTTTPAASSNLPRREPIHHSRVARTA